MGCQYAAESCMNSTLTSKGYKGVRLGQMSLLLPGWFIIAYKWLSGGARVSERGAAPCSDLDTVSIQIHCSLYLTLSPGSSKPHSTESWAGALPCSSAISGCQSWGRQVWLLTLHRGLTH